MSQTKSALPSPAVIYSREHNQWEEDMNQLISSNALTMTSQEISDLIQSRHDNVKRTSLLPMAQYQHKGYFETGESNGRAYHPELVELVESRHDNVKRTIERLAESGAIQLPPLVEVRNHLGQAVSVYHQTRFTPAGLSWIAGRLA